jgi:hypothetical protein
MATVDTTDAESPAYLSTLDRFIDTFGSPPFIYAKTASRRMETPPGSPTVEMLAAWYPKHMDDPDVKAMVERAQKARAARKAAAKKKKRADAAAHDLRASKRSKGAVFNTGMKITNPNARGARAPPKIVGGVGKRQGEPAAKALAKPAAKPAAK